MANAAATAVRHTRVHHGRHPVALVAMGLAVSSLVAAPAVPARARAAQPVYAAHVPSGKVERTAADEGRLLFTFRDARINESSGMAVSPTHRGVIYTHNDSGDGPRFFAVGMDGRTRATFTLAGAEARDWEAMAATVDPKTGRGVLWFGDIGDNLRNQREISVYKVMEPRSLRDATLQATRYRLRYADGPRDAEGLMVHPRTGRLYIVSKEFAGSVYAAPAKLRSDRVNVLRRVGPAPIMATDAAYAPDGSSFVIRTYFSASVYRAPGKLLARVTMPPLDQAESIAYTRDGTALLTGSEGVSSPVYRVPLPPEARARPAPSVPARTARPTASRMVTASSNPAGGTTDDAGVLVPLSLLWIGVAVGAIGVIILIAYRTGR